MKLQTSETHSNQSKGLFWLMVIGVFFILVFHVSPFWGLSYLLWFKGLMIGLAIVGLINAAILLGYRHAFIFLGLGALIGFSMEYMGVQTGSIFGPYKYSNLLGFKIGGVPWVIPLCWFALVYFAHVITNLIIYAHPVTQSKTLLHSAIISFLTAIVATGMDMALDPALSHPDVNAWIWTTGGQYFGVPFKNFQGWVITAFLIDFGYRLYSHKRSPQPLTPLFHSSANYAILAWAGLGLGFMVIGFPVETQLIAVFCVILPAFLALANFHIRQT